MTSPVERGAEVLDKGTDTLFSAISALPPGVQITLLLLIATNVATALGWWRSVAYVLFLLAEERRLGREDSVATRNVLEQNNIALALIKDRLK